MHLWATGCGWLVEAGENGARGRGAEDKVSLNDMMVETKETSPSLLKGEETFGC